MEQPENPTFENLKPSTTRDCIALGSFITSPIENLYTEANEFPLSLHSSTKLNSFHASKTVPITTTYKWDIKTCLKIKQSPSNFLI